MKLGLAIRNGGPQKQSNGTTKLHNRNLSIVDLNTGDELEEKVAYLWGSKNLLLSGPEPLLTEEYFEGDPDDASYVVLVFRCDSAHELISKPTTPGPGI